MHIWPRGAHYWFWPDITESACGHPENTGPDDPRIYGGHMLIQWCQAKINNGRPWAKCAYFFQNQWSVLTCLGIMSSAREYEGRLRFGQKLSHGGRLNWLLLKKKRTLKNDHGCKINDRFHISYIYWAILHFILPHPFPFFPLADNNHY